MTAQNTLPDPEDIIFRGCHALQITLPRCAVGKMLRHMSLLAEWQTRTNLTSLTNPADVAVRHFLDSLTVIKVLPWRPNLQLLDIGTGAGFPGVVLRTALESLELTLLDRSPKKIVFLKSVVQEIGFKNVHFLCTDLRALIASPASYTFDVVVSRAFSSDPGLIDRLHVLVRTGGGLVRMGGPASQSEPLSLKHFELTEQWEGILPFSNHFRRVLYLTKVSGSSG
jgi:16S rRNA (guanine527-N7)-methyltransferase